jgi:GT2 family glycosyltransferase
MKISVLPFFSIIIPTYGRPDRLQECLQAIARSSYARDRFEVIVVDDGSPQPQDEVAAKFETQLDLKLLRQENAGPATARNTGAAQAQGEFLTFTDDDCAPAPDYLQKLAECFAQTPASLVVGKTINTLTDNPYSSASQMLIDYIYAYFNAQQPRFFASNNFAVTKALFHRIGGFDTTYPLAAAEDRDFCERWRFHGYPMIYAPEAYIYHAHTLTGRKFWRQHFNYGRGAFHFHQARAKYNREPTKPNRFHFIWTCLGLPLRRRRGSARRSWQRCSASHRQPRQRVSSGSCSSGKEIRTLYDASQRLERNDRRKFCGCPI